MSTRALDLQCSVPRIQLVQGLEYKLYKVCNYWEQSLSEKEEPQNEKA